MPAENVGSIRFAFQTVKGTKAAASVYGSRLAGGTMVGPMRTDEFFDETTGAQMRDARYPSEVHAAGAPEMFVPPNAAAAMLYAVLGDVATTGIADPWSHEITAATSLPWMTWWRNVGALLFGYSIDCKVTQLVISGEANKPLRMTATVMGLDPRYASAEETTATIEITDRVLYYDGKGALQLEGAAVPCMRSFTLTINRNGESIPGDDIIPCDITEGLFDITLATTALFTDVSLYNRIMFGSATPSADAAVSRDIFELGGTGVDFLFTRVAASPGPERSIHLEIPRMAVDPFEPAIGTGNSPMTQVLSMSALQPAAGASPITATVLNGLDDLVAPS
jgi:hypothetical protein